MPGTMPQGGPLSSRQAFEQEVLRRARSDAAFKAHLLSDPKAALRAVFGIEVPPDVEIRALEETPSRFFIVLPLESPELSAEDLEQVAGGAGVLDVKGSHAIYRRRIDTLGEHLE